MVLMAACTCEDHEQIITELPDVFIINETAIEGDQIVLYFSSAIDQQSIQINENIVITAQNGNNLFTLTIEDNAIFIPFCDVDCGDVETCTINIDVQAFDGNPILSADGQVLDGDQDGSAGGAFNRAFAIDNCFIPSFQVIENPNSPTIYEGIADIEIWNNEIIVDFNRTVDPMSVILNETLFFFSPMLNEYILVNGFLTWNETYTSLTITSNAGNYCMQINQSCNCELRLELTDAIRDNGDEALDGNYDGIPGEMYTRTINYEATNTVNILGDWYVDNSAFLHIDLFKFKYPLNPATVEPQKSIFFRCNDVDEPPREIILEWLDDNTGFNLVVVEDVFMNCGTSFQFFIEMTDDIIDVNGRPLDGDFDGIAGGNYNFSGFY